MRVSTYTVLVDENSHYQDEGERYGLCTTFGEDPFIRAAGAVPDARSSMFSAWEYSRVRCDLLCAP